jgi:hypothetical protein
LSAVSYLYFGYNSNKEISGVGSTPVEEEGEKNMGEKQKSGMKICKLTL